LEVIKVYQESPNDFDFHLFDKCLSSIIDKMKEYSFLYTSSPYFDKYIKKKTQISNIKLELNMDSSPKFVNSGRKSAGNRKKKNKKSNILVFHPESSPVWIETLIDNQPVWIVVYFKIESVTKLIGYPQADSPALSLQFVIDISKIPSTKDIYIDSVSYPDKYVWFINSHDLKLSNRTIKERQVWISYLKNRIDKKKLKKGKKETNLTDINNSPDIPRPKDDITLPAKTIIALLYESFDCNENQFDFSDYFYTHYPNYQELTLEEFNQFYNSVLKNPQIPQFLIENSQKQVKPV